jgi:hypothetical protein
MSRADGGAPPDIAWPAVPDIAPAWPDIAFAQPDLLDPRARCKEIVYLANVVIGENRACMSDGECLLVKTRCGMPAYCGEYMTTVGRDNLTALVIQWDQLGCGDAIDCAPCPPQGAPPACRNGICAPRR